MTVQELYDKFGLAQKDISDVGSIWFQWVNVLNHFFYRNVQRFEPDRFITEETYTGNGEFDLPTDLDNLRMGECGLWLVDSSGNYNRGLPTGSRIAQFASYRLTSSKVILQNLSSDSQRVDMLYIPTLGEVSEVSDSLILDEEWTEVNIEELKRIYFEWDKNGAQETNADERLNRSLKELMDNYTRQPKVATL